MNTGFEKLKIFLDKKVDQYDQPSFIPFDPICIPHLFKKKQDIEIAAFFAAIFAWGNRTTIIRKSTELMQAMDMAPYEFILHHRESDLRRLMDFKHRTFNATDLLYFIDFFKHHYTVHKTLETAFTRNMKKEDVNTENALAGFRHYFFSLDEVPVRTMKHIATPERNSTCKRLSMFLRWMVRKDKNGVDFGIWKNIHPSQLVCPVDIHVARVAKKLNLLSRKPVDWLAAKEITAHLKMFDAEDPVKYDFALFGLGVVEKYG